MLTRDDGPSMPPLPEDAGPHERTLYGIYGFSTGATDWSAKDWGTTADSVTGMATEVRAVVRALQGADQPWTGPAADSAFSSLGELAKALDARAQELQDIQTGLTQAAEYGRQARIDYGTKVRSVSTTVERASYESTPPRTSGSQPVPDGKVFDQSGYDQAVGAAQAEREAAALKVLTTFTENMGDAAKQLPVDPVADPVRIDPGTGGGGDGGGGYPGGSGPSGGSYAPPSGGSSAGFVGQSSTTGGGLQVGVWHGPEVGQPVQPVQTVQTVDPPTTQPPLPPVAPVDPVLPLHPGPEVTIDGGTVGSTGPDGGFGPLAGQTGGSASAGSGSGPGLGGAAGMGGMLAGGGAAAILGRGGMAGGAGRPMVLPGATGSAASARGGSVAAGRGGAAAAGRGGALGAGGAGKGGVLGAAGQGAAGRSGVVGAAGQGGAGRGGGSAGRGGGGGAARTGRYGVPKLDGSSGRGSGGMVAGGGAGSRGGKRGTDEDPQDVERLTTEDEETWFEGEDDATPPVWR